MIMIPIVITIAKTLGWHPVSLALPAALTIDWVVGLPISGKPNVILFSTNQYSVVDNFKYGIAVCTIGVILIVISGATWFHWLGVTPSFFATPAAQPAAAASIAPAAVGGPMPMPSLVWLGAGAALSAGYLYGFRDLTRRPS
jgi:hypothetical protein